MRKLLLVLVLIVAACSKKSDDKAKQNAPAKDPGGKLDTDAIAATAIPGFTINVMNKSDKDITMSIAGEAGGKKLGVLATVASCSAMPCPPINEDDWKKQLDTHKMILSGAVKDDPNTVFDVGTKDVAGKKANYQYMMGWAKQGESAASAHGYNVFWNDGEHSVTLMISEADWRSANSFDEFKAGSDRAAFEQGAEILLEAFTEKL